jgi:inner membrane protein
MFNKEQSAWENFFNSISFRLLVIGFLILILLIPLGSVKELIRERQFRNKEVAGEISSKWGEKQTLSGPVLTIPYDKEVVTYNKKKEVFVTELKTEYLHILPESLHYNCTLLPEERYRGIFKVIVYRALVQSEGYFKLPDLKDLDLNKDVIHWDEAQIGFRLSDFRSLQDDIKFLINGTVCKFESGTATGIADGVSANIALDPAVQDWTFNFELGFNGSSDIMFTPLGKTTTADVSSSWTDPSFIGEFLPDNRNIDEEGFTADWKILHLNRPIKQIYLNRKYIPLENQHDFGISLFLPVDHYTKTERSVKYSVLLIFLAFISFFAAAAINKIRIHPVQYLLIGFALCVFYSLLLSISEQLGFNSAYWIAAVATIILLFFYAKAILKNKKFALSLGAVILLLYLFIFVIIQLQDLALLVGSIGLFVTVSILMYLSVKLKILN